MIKKPLHLMFDKWKCLSTTDTSISSEKLKEEFLNLITHEFQTPLVPIIGFSQALQNPEIYGNLTEKQLDAVKRIFRNSNHLLNMILMF